MKKAIIPFFAILIAFQSLFSAEFDIHKHEKSFQSSDQPSRGFKGSVSSTFKIELSDYSRAFNPSIAKCEDGYILIFRYSPEPCGKPWLNYMGAVLLDWNFQPVNSGELLDIRFDNRKTPSQAEDARIFTFQGRYYLTYNDNPEVRDTSPDDRRDIYIAELSYENGRFWAHPAVRLYHPVMYEARLWEKNWMPFEWNNQLLISYTFNPHEVLSANLETGECTPVYSTSFPTDWMWGPLRGGTPASLVDGEYFAFFHTAERIESGATNKNQRKWHYYMGAYTFSADPPFHFTKASPMPINDKSFYINPYSEKRVVYPGGYVISGDDICLAYGKDDGEIWISIFNKSALMGSLKPVN